MRRIVAASLWRAPTFSYLTRSTLPRLCAVPIVLVRAMSDTVADLSATPAEGQRIKHNNVIYTTKKEGLAHILIPENSVQVTKDTKDGQTVQTVQQVFYNPIQQFNRDLTVLAIRAYGKERMQQKQAASTVRMGKFADKKRKRKERAQAQAQVEGERPAKSPKVDGGSTAEGVASAQADAEMHDAAEQDPNALAGDEVPTAATTEDAGTAEEATAEPAAQPAAEPASNGEVAKKDPHLSFTILDALSASGLRALRYAHEIPFTTTVTANDILKTAAAAIERNAVHNGLKDKINISVDDALAHMYSVVIRELRNASQGKSSTGPSAKYDVVDLDPYGSASPFLDAAVQAVRSDGGLLCVTCTDSGVWASNGYPEKCYALYGGVPVKGWYSHEVGLRLILHAIETSAARYGLAMEPLLSLSVDFYSRVFVRIRKSPSMVKFQGGKNMLVYSCGTGCGAWTTQPLMRNKPAPNKKGSGIFYKHGFTRAPTTGTSCEHCGSTMHLAGPMYAGRLHSPDFVRSVIAEADEADPEVYGTKDRVRGMLQTALEEFLPTPEEAEAEEKERAEQTKTATKLLKKSVTEAQVAAVDPYPFYFHPASVSGILHCASPPENALRGALVGLGYRVTRSHCKAGSMKTDAPWSVIWDVFREWVRQKAPVKEENIKTGSVAFRLLRLGKKEEAAAADAKATETAAAESNGEGAKADEKTPAENGEDENPGDETRAENGTAAKAPKVVFDEQLGRLQEKTKYVRYQMNPRENWGPMNRATGK